MSIPFSSGDSKVDDLYGLLQVEHSAPADVIRKNFRRLAVQLHPDKGGDPDKFAALRGAYDTLSDPAKR